MTMTRKNDWNGWKREWHFAMKKVKEFPVVPKKLGVSRATRTWLREVGSA